MNKQKQFEIEKLTNIIKNCCCDIKAEYNCAAMCETCIAEDLYNAGYRKIPEGSVVLTEAELDKKLEPFRLEIIALSQELVQTRFKPIEVDPLEEYKKGFKEGVQAMQVQMDNIAKELTEGM